MTSSCVWETQLSSLDDVVLLLWLLESTPLLSAELVLAGESPHRQAEALCKSGLHTGAHISSSQPFPPMSRDNRGTVYGLVVSLMEGFHIRPQ